MSIPRFVGRYPITTEAEEARTSFLGLGLG